MKTPQKVIWSEGLLMAPQHLQQVDAYHESMLAARLDALEPNNWGVVKLELDKKALNSGSVALELFEGVFASGLSFGADQSALELPQSRPVQDFFPHTQNMLEVYLGVPREREGIANVAEERAPRVRYSIGRRTVADLTGAASHVEMDFARRNLVILFGTEPRDDYESIKIAELTRGEAGGLVAVETYIPPLLSLHASPYIATELNRILNLMTARRRALSEQRRERDASTIEFSASDVTRFLLLNAINGFVPVMSHFASGGEATPREAYLLLVQLAGQLATFSVDFDLSAIPRYAFTDLRMTFGTLFEQISTLLQASVREHHVAIPLDARQDGMHIAQIKDERFAQCTQFLLAVQGTMPEQDIAAGLPRLAKIAGWTEINGILSAATPGAPVEATFRPPAEVPVKAGTVYFTIQSENAYWRGIARDKNIAVYLPRPYEPTTTKVQVIGVIGRGPQKPFAP